ncbi:hypothetical protein [Avibacterium paragallinarum]|uniref:hypothetical protein n=1 Tax=Avibacterium paragallinarum TaxID=728 RepID=UPI003986A685
MKELNRIEYLILAASLLPEKIKQNPDKSVVFDKTIELARRIKVEYENRYRYEEDDEKSELSTHLD